MQNTSWMHCPVCGQKTRDKIRQDTIVLSQMQTGEFDTNRKITYYLLVFFHDERCYHDHSHQVPASEMVYEYGAY